MQSMKRIGAAVVVAVAVLTACETAEDHDAVVAACLDVARDGLREIASDRARRFQGKVEEYRARCRGGEKAVAPTAGQGASLPAVTVIVPGRQDIPATISATGSLAARRDMPVGIAGEGGQVDRVLVEPGQWVRAGQTLAVIDRSVQSQ